MGVLSFMQGADPLIALVKASERRKQAANLRIRYYRDRQADELLRLILETWPDAEGWRLFQINLVRKIIDMQAMVYRVAPIRSFDGWDQDEGDQLYRDLNANVLLKKANRLTKLCKTTALQVAWSERRDRPVIHLITPNVLDAEYSDPEFPDRFVITHPGAKEQDTEYSDWTSTGYRRLDYRGHPIPVPDNRNGENPYGELPFVPLFDYAPDDEFFLPGGDDLIEAQSAINVEIANLWRAMEMASHGQAWMSPYTPSPGTKAPTLSPATVIGLPEDGSFGFAAPNTPIEGVLKAIDFLIRQTAVANDIAANVFELDPKAESGIAKAYETRALIEARSDDLDLWRNYESRLFETIKLVANTHKPGSIPESATLSIDFGEIALEVSQADRLESYRQRIELGIWSQVDALMADNPDIRSREDALKELQKRADEAAVLGAPFAGPKLESAQ